MNKKAFLMSILLLLSFISPSINHTSAQIFTVPEPQCVKWCDDENDQVKNQPKVTIKKNDLENIQKNLSKTLDFLEANITKITNLLKLKYYEMVDRFKNFYDNWINKK